MTELYQDIIALLTDFGSRGQHYIASMKGVILKINPNIKLIDISHTISSYSIIEASYLIKSSYRYFPEFTVFIIVIDPGVGSSRNILALRTKSNYFFVGPDNGIFSSVFTNDEIEKCVIIDNDNYFNKPVSNTFHGRDIMAPVGAHITNGVPLANFGPYFDPNNLVQYPIKYEVLLKEKKVNCTIQYIDSFGNITTNIPLENKLIKGTSIKLEERYTVKIITKDHVFKGKFASHFAEVPKDSLLFLKGSSDYLEISINLGNAAEYLGLKVGEIISIVLE